MRLWKFVLPLFASTLCFAAQSDRITGPIDSSQMTTLPGHINRNAKPQYDQGRVEPSLQFGYVTLVIAPSPSQQIALDLLLAQQQDRSSPNYHKWLTPEQYADRFGLSQKDVDKITTWLQSQGFAVLSVPRGRNSVIFKGTAAQIESAFRTEIHRYSLNGEKHIANSTAVSVPAALIGVVSGIRGLTDFRPKPTYVRPARTGKTGLHPTYTTTIDGTTEYVVAPGDIATLYDLNPLYNASTPIDGTGQKLAIIGETDVYLADLVDFRSSSTGFNLPSFTCATGSTGLITSCDTPNFQYVLVGEDEPVSVGDLLESDLDLEWSGAVARNAQIIFVNAPINTAGTSGGVNNALAYAIENVTAPVISMSYGACEAEAESLETVLQQGNTEGITILISSGDTGAAGCDYGPPNNAVKPPFSPAVGGLTVNYPASSPEVTGVGGTSIPTGDFTSTYWSASNGTYGVSALSTLVGQELPWNDDEAFAQLCLADPSNAFCTEGGSPPVTGWVAITSAATAQEDIWIAIGAGGVSNCFNETAGDICTSGFPKPTWQQGITIPGLTSPQSTYRFVPDVSLLASPDFPGYIICTPLEEVESGTSTASTCASGISTAVDTYFSLVGGTSASSPVFAGIVTLLNQYLGGSGLGNINPTLYTLAASPSNGAFHRVESGDNDVYCHEGDPVGQPSDVICPSTGASAGIIGFDASNDDSTGGTGYNLVTGLGSVDANALALAWKASLGPAQDFTLVASTLTPGSISAGQSASATLTVTPVNNSTQTINFTAASCSGLPAGASCSFSPSSLSLDGTDPESVTLTITTLANMAVPSGAQPVTITGTASGTGGESHTATVSLTVTATTETFSLSAPNGATYTATVGGKASVAVLVSSTTGFIVGTGAGATTAVPLTYTCSGSPNLATAEISCQISPGGSNQPTNATSVTVTLQTTPPTAQLRPLLGGSHIFYALLLPGLFGVVCLAGSRTRGLRLLSLIVVLGFSTLWLGSCGGGGGTNTSPTNPGTPANTYVVTISATTGGANPVSNSNSPFTFSLVVGN